MTGDNLALQDGCLKMIFFKLLAILFGYQI